MGNDKGFWTSGIPIPWDQSGRYIKGANYESLPWPRDQTLDRNGLPTQAEPHMMPKELFHYILFYAPSHFFLCTLLGLRAGM